MQGRRHLRRTIVWGVNAVLGVVVSASHALPVDVDLRGGAAPMSCERVDFERGGLRVTKAGVPSVIAWDHVRGISGRTMTDGERDQLRVAEDLWRARSRVQRGDLALATALFERHFASYVGTTSETALIVAEGLLRCRIEQDPLRAVVPALEVARLRRAGVTTDRFQGLPPVIDETTLLCPALAPFWADDAATAGLAAELEAYVASPEKPTSTPDGQPALKLDTTSRRVAELYAAILTKKTIPTAKREEGSLGLLTAIMELEAAATAEPESRERARAAALAVTRSLPVWANAWARHAVGRSLLQESDRAKRMDGVLLLLEVSSFGQDAPRGLRRLSLGLAATTLRSLGDAESAAVVERELAALGGAASIPTATPVRPAVGSTISSPRP